MTRLRFTLAQLMAAVIFIGLGFAALRSASPLWASAVFTLTVAVLSAAILGAMARRGRARLTWAGFALFGWIYFGTTFGPWADGNGVKAPPYMTRWVLDYALARLRNTNRLVDSGGVPGEVLFSPFPTWGIGGGMGGGNGNGGGMGGGNGNARRMGRYQMGGGMGGGVPGPPAAVPDALQFRRIGHCLTAILFGLVGTVLGRLIAAKDDQPNH
jgi:hypothetical protein